jgi:hypothetical protein
MHEDYKRQPEVILSSDRTFGLVWTAILLLYGIAPLRHGAHFRMVPLAIAAVLALVSFLVPGLLHFPNRVWARLAILLHRIVNPVVMAALFVIVFIPGGLLYRLRKKDAMGRRLDPDASSYWIKREPAGPSPESMINQF